MAAATIGLVPALADSGDPDLPKITAQQLIEKIAASDVQQLSGTVKISTDLGLPDLGGLASGLASGAVPGDGELLGRPAVQAHRAALGTHTLRVAADGPDRRKVSLLENAAEYSVDPQRQGRVGLRQQVQRGLPRDGPRERGGREGSRDDVPATPRTSPTRRSSPSTTRRP